VWAWANRVLNDALKASPKTLYVGRTP